MYHFNFVRPQNDLACILNGNEWVDVTETLESRMARQGLMVGLSITRGTVIFHLLGEMNSESSYFFKELLETFLNGSYNALSLDLSGLAGLDETGLRVVSWLRLEILKKGGTLNIINPAPILLTNLPDVEFCYSSTIKDYGCVVSAN